MMNDGYSEVHDFRNGAEVQRKASNGSEKQGAVPSLVAISARDFMKRAIPPRKMLLGPILAERGSAMLHGKRGTGKTHIALAIGVAASSGKDFLRFKAGGACKTLFVDGELPEAVLQQWLAETILSVGGPETGDNLRLITQDQQEFGIPDLATLEGQLAIAKHVEWADLIILDNLSSLVRSGKENEAESWLPIQAWALALRRKGKALLFVHHSGRNDQARGTSKREDLLDTIMALKHPHDYKPSEGLRAEVHFTKSRHFWGDDAEPFEAALTSGENSAPIWTMKEIEASNYDKAVKLFEEGCDAVAVKEELGLSRATAFRYRKDWKLSQQSQGSETK